MSTQKCLLTATAAAFITSTAIAAAQQSPLPRFPPEKVIPPSKGLNSPASPGLPAVTDGAGEARKDTTKEVEEGNRTGELQEYQGRSDTTGRAPSREQNRVPTEKKSDKKL
jgi:hypothetical protein